MFYIEFNILLQDAGHAKHITNKILSSVGVFVFSLSDLLAIRRLSLLKETLPSAYWQLAGVEAGNLHGAHVQHANWQLATPQVGCSQLADLPIASGQICKVQIPNLQSCKLLICKLHMCNSPISNFHTCKVPQWNRHHLFQQGGLYGQEVRKIEDNNTNK